MSEATAPETPEEIPGSDCNVVLEPTGRRRTIGTHGTDIMSLALSPSGDLLASGASNGTVRVARVDGSERTGSSARAAVPFADFGGDAAFWWTSGGPKVLAWTLDGRASPARRGTAAGSRCSWAILRSTRRSPFGVPCCSSST